MLSKIKDKVTVDVKYVVFIVFVAGVILGVLAGPPALKAFGMNVVSDDLTRQHCGQIMLDCQNKVSELDARIRLLEQQVCILRQGPEADECYK